MLSHHLLNKKEWTQYDDYSFNHEMAYCGSSELRDKARDRFLSFKHKDCSEIFISGRANSKSLRLSFTTSNIEKCKNINLRFMSGSCIKMSLIDNKDNKNKHYQFSLDCDNDDTAFISLFFELVQEFHQIRETFVTHILRTIQINERLINEILLTI